jgi:hypothetical protein
MSAASYGDRLVQALAPLRCAPADFYGRLKYLNCVGCRRIWNETYFGGLTARNDVPRLVIKYVGHFD